MRRLLIGAVVATAWIAALWAGTAAADAHATLIASSPSDGAHVNSVPHEVSFSLSESVEAVAGSAAIIDHAGHRVALSSMRVDSGGRRLVIDLAQIPGDGAYLATAQVVSADTHVVSVSVRFTAGSVTSVDDAPTPPKQPQISSVATGVVKVAVYLGLILSAGTLLALRWAWPEELSSKRFHVTYRVGIAVLVVGLIGRFAILAAQQSRDVPVLSSLNDVASHRAGAAIVASGVLGVLAAATIAGAPRRRVVAYAAAGAGILAVTLAGHGGATQRWPLSLVDTLVHVYAASVWFGGVCVVAMVLRAPRGTERWHKVAAGHVGAVFVSGVILAVMQVSPALALVRTDYGLLLLAKAGAVVVAVATGYMVYRSRDHIGPRSVALDAEVATRHGEAPVSAPDGSLRVVERPSGTTTVGARTGSRVGLIAVEVVVAVVVMTLTALVSSAGPARDSYTTDVAVTLRFEQSHILDVSINTIRRGEQTMTLSPGEGIVGAQVSAELSSAQANIARLPVDLVALPKSSGWRSQGLIVPAPGQWKVTVRYDWGAGPRLASFTTTVL